MNLYLDNIVYDLQHIGGISTYWFELTSRFLRSGGLNLNFYETGFGNENLLRRKLDLRNVPVTVSGSGALLLERFRRLNDWKFEEQSIFHSSYFRVPVRNNQVKVVSTVHDFTHDLYFKGPRLWLHNFAKRRTILESDAIITVSEHTKKDLLHFYPGIDESKVKVIYNGVSEDFKPDASAGSGEGISLLYVGARDDYKNFRFAVQLAAAEPEACLDIVGPALTAAERLFVELQLKGRYRVHTKISNAELNRLYNRAACLLYPSAYEGFGIPLLEAMRAGCPFIALNASSIPEVAGDAGYLLSSLNLEEAAAALKTIISSRTRFAERGHQQAQKFSWDKCYDETFQLYKQLI